MTAEVVWAVTPYVGLVCPLRLARLDTGWITNARTPWPR
jgi:hypothetical protein